MDKEKYIKLIERIIYSEKLSPEEKKYYIMMLETIKNMDVKDANDYEQKSYMVGGRKLTDKERILYELNYLKKIGKEDKERIIKKYAYQLNSNKTKSNYDRLKKEITKLQLENNIKPRFYSVFESMLNEETEESIDDIVIRQTKEVKKTR